MPVFNDLLLYTFGPKDYWALPLIGVVKACLFFPLSLVYSVTDNAVPATSILQNF